MTKHSLRNTAFDSPIGALYAVRFPPSLHVDCGDCAGAARAATRTAHTRQHVIMQAITASNTLAAPKVAARNLGARRTVKALAPRCVRCFIRVRGQ